MRSTVDWNIKRRQHGFGQHIDAACDWGSHERSIGKRKNWTIARAMFSINTHDIEGVRMNHSGTVQLHRVSRNPGGDFSAISHISLV
jgi:hypothetical protein